jgi:C-terminal processing protease CtpA/Prc
MSIWSFFLNYKKKPNSSILLSKSLKIIKTRRLFMKNYKKYLFLFFILTTFLFAKAEEVEYNLDYHLKYFYDAKKGDEMKQIIKSSSNGKCITDTNNETICKMSEEEFKSIIDKESIQGLSILEIPAVNGGFGGLGVTIGKKPNDSFHIIKAFKGSPAYGVLEADDEILEIDSIPTKTLTLDTLVQKLRGDPDSKVTLQIKRNDEILTKTFTRKIIKISDEEMILSLDDEHLTLSFENGFDVKSNEKLARLIFQKPYKKLTLDMRRSYGGNFGEILASLGLFLPENKELFYTMQGGDKETQSTPRKKVKRFDKEVEIIIDETTHSGSLLFAYAMKKYYPKCKVIGDKSGKFDYLYAVKELPTSAKTEKSNIRHLLKYAIGEFYTIDGELLSGKNFFEVK